MSNWPSALAEGLRSGTAASLLSTAVLMASGRHHAGHRFAATNATSQWLWGRPALHANAPTLRHTAVGYAVHHGASIFWATLHARATQDLPGARTLGGALAGGLVTAAVACVVDFCFTPQRLTPGFEHRLPRSAIGVAYLAFGMAIGAAALCWRRRRGAHDDAARAVRGEEA